MTLAKIIMTALVLFSATSSYAATACDHGVAVPRDANTNPPPRTAVATTDANTTTTAR